MMKRLRAISNLPLAQNVFRNSFWNILASVTQRGTIFLVGIIVARLVDTELYGKYTLIKSTVQVFELSLGIAFGLSMTKFVSESKYSEKKKDIAGVIKTNFLSSTVLSLLLFCVLEISSGFLANEVLNDPELLNLFRIALLYVLFSNIFHCFVGLLKGEEEFKSLFQINLFTAFLNLILVSILTYFFSLRGAVWALVLFSLVQVSSYFIFILKRSRHFEVILDKNVSIDYEVIKKFNLPAILSGLAAPPAIWYINVTLSQEPNGFSELAFFNVAFLIFAVIVFLPVSVADAIFPLLNKAFAKATGFKKFFLTNLFVVFIIASFFSVIPIFYPHIFLSLFGSEYLAAKEALQYLSLAAIFSSLLTVLGKFIATINKMWINLSFNVLWSVTAIILTTLFLNEGSVGVAKAYLYSYMLLFVVQFIYALVKIRKL